MRHLRRETLRYARAGKLRQPSDDLGKLYAQAAVLSAPFYDKIHSLLRSYYYTVTFRMSDGGPSPHGKQPCVRGGRCDMPPGVELCRFCLANELAKELSKYGGCCSQRTRK